MISFVPTQYDMPIWEIIVRHDCEIELYNHRLNKTIKNALRDNLLSILFAAPAKKEEVQQTDSIGETVPS